MSGTVRNTRGNIPYCSAECARTVETDTRSSLYKEDFSLENSIAAFRYVNAVADYDGKPIFWHYKQRLREYLGTLNRRFIDAADAALAISIGLAKKD